MSREVPNEAVSIAQKLTTLVVPYDSTEYRAALKLRDELLRKPLGLQFTEKELKNDKRDFHIVAKLGDEVIACLVLTPNNEGLIQMRQVAVSENYQGQGIGRTLVEDSEFFAREKGYTMMFCHARDIAVPFYKELGYTTVGEVFVEVGIEHLRMQKKLTAE